MSFPAYKQLDDSINATTGKNIRRGFARWRVYRYLVKVLNFKRPVEVKAHAVASYLHMSPRNVIEALDWLAENRYLEEHGRGERRVRSLTLEYDINPEKAA